MESSQKMNNVPLSTILGVEERKNDPKATKLLPPPAKQTRSPNYAGTRLRKFVAINNITTSKSRRREIVVAGPNCHRQPNAGAARLLPNLCQSIKVADCRCQSFRRREGNCLCLCVCVSVCKLRLTPSPRPPPPPAHPTPCVPAYCNLYPGKTILMGVLSKYNCTSDSILPLYVYWKCQHLNALNPNPQSAIG